MEGLQPIAQFMGTRFLRQKRIAPRQGVPRKVPTSSETVDSLNRVCQSLVHLGFQFLNPLYRYICVKLGDLALEEGR